MLSWSQLSSNFLVKLGERTGRTHALPLVMFAPTARCNSRCVSCGWWQADGAGDLKLPEIRALAADLARFGTKLVVLTGGEPLLRADVMEVADIFLRQGMTLHLLTSGLALERHAEAIAERFVDVTVSLDGHTAELYRAIRGVDALDVVASGVAKLRRLAPTIALRARSTIHRHNFRFLSELCAKSFEMGFDQISFLTADVTSDSFNRGSLPRVDAGAPQLPDLLLREADVLEFEKVVESTIRSYGAELAARRIVPGPDGLRRLVAYFRAHLGQGPFPVVDCNAPWTSVVIEADGTIRPCFFHPAVGNLRQRPLAELLTVAMPSFRGTLDVATNATCQRCVCTMRVGLRSQIW